MISSVITYAMYNGQHVLVNSTRQNIPIDLCRIWSVQYRLPYQFCNNLNRSFKKLQDIVTPRNDSLKSNHLDRDEPATHAFANVVHEDQLIAEEPPLNHTMDCNHSICKQIYTITSCILMHFSCIQACILCTLGILMCSLSALNHTKNTIIFEIDTHFFVHTFIHI